MTIDYIVEKFDDYFTKAITSKPYPSAAEVWKYNYNEFIIFQVSDIFIKKKNVMMGT